MAEAVQQEQAKLAEQAKAETAQFVEERRAKAERFFNQPLSLANFQHWAQAAYWTLEEATALAFGKEPWVVNLKSVSPHAGFSPFPANYVRLKDLVERAQEVGKLGDQVMPSDFIAWAKAAGIDYPPELETELIAQGQLVDWKAAHDQLKVQYDDLKAQTDRAAAIKSNAGQKKEKGLHARERESLLKLVIAMAKGGYGYDSSADRSPTTTEIVSDLDKLGLHLDPDTVRKWVREARGLLPSMESEADDR